MKTSLKPKKPLASRYKKLIKSTGAELAAEVRATIRNSEWVLPKKAKDQLRKKYKYKNDFEMMVVLASSLKDFAIAPISEFEVPVVGFEKETGNLLVGCNVEFPGANLNFSIHAEQFLFARAFSRGTTISEFALGVPLPCGHCRQFITEFNNAKKIKLGNANGLSMTLEDLLPLSFGPADLKQNGISKNLKPFRLHAEGDDLVFAALKAANKSYAPYTQTPSGVAFRTSDGAIFSGAYIENAAFNPSLSPMHTAIIDLLAHSRTVGEISDAVLVQSSRMIDQRAAAATLLQIMAPRVRLNTISV
jgi:cytidine deaminase